MVTQAACGWQVVKSKLRSNPRRGQDRIIAIGRVPGLHRGAATESAMGVRSAQTGTTSIDPALNTWHRAQFSWADVLRRAQGDAFEAFGLGPTECPYRVVASGPHWRLRNYVDQDTSPPILIVAAPIKRPYIWDLAPSVSAIRYCIRNRLLDSQQASGLPSSQTVTMPAVDVYQSLPIELRGLSPRMDAGFK